MAIGMANGFGRESVIDGVTYFLKDGFGISKWDTEWGYTKLVKSNHFVMKL